MLEGLVHLFVKDSENIHDAKVRAGYGTFASLMGMACNVFLCVLKLVIGSVIHSLSIMSDGFNNLSDCLSNALTLIGSRAASRPADEEHPFGHGRMEYIVSLFASVMIFIVAAGLLKESVTRILDPEPVFWSLPLFIILAASILVKFWMYYFNHELGNKIRSTALLAASVDSRNDMIATGMTLVSLLLSRINDAIPFDGIMGALVSIYIFKSGWDLFQEILTRLIGSTADPELSSSIEKIMTENPAVQGIHDLVLHEYGPEQIYGSVHAEMDEGMDLVHAHEIADEAERKIQEQLHVTLTVHMDPVSHDEETEKAKEIMLERLRAMDESLSIHDFQLKKEGEKKSLSFDILMPYGCKLKEEEILSALNDDIYEVHVHFDHGTGNL